MYRRQFLKTLAAGAAAVSPILNSAHAYATPVPTDLVIGTRTLDINGKSASVFGLADRTGKPGLVLDAGTDFNVRLVNDTAEGTLIHWHGLTPPWEMDGVPDNPAALLGAGESRNYKFPVGPGGTHWMHAHTLQEQRLLAAPLIVRTSEDRARDEQEVVILLHDFSFRSPEELLEELKGAGSGHGNGMPMDHRSMMGRMSNMPGQHQMPMTGMPMTGMPTMDLNDIEYDAYLANDRTLDDPEVVRVEKGGRVRLRIINGATATAFTVDVGNVTGNLVAVDGNAVAPVSGNRFPISMGQRLDIRLTLLGGAGAFPIFALREGSKERTGIVLATQDAEIRKFSATAREPGPALDLSLEQQFRAVAPLPVRTADHNYGLALTGGMMNYVWQLEASEPLIVSKGQRVRVAMQNMSMMTHPMHLHGHHFQVVAINGKPLAGAVRDTVHVPPMTEVVVEFDAKNPGRWPLHCHHLYHMATGMMTFVAYDGAI